MANDCISVNALCGCGLGYKRTGTHSWVNKCPYCGKATLHISTKRCAECHDNQITCSSCDTDFCGQHGYSLEGHRRYKLTPCPKTTTQSVKATSTTDTTTESTTPPPPVLTAKDVPVSSLVSKSVLFDKVRKAITPVKVNETDFNVHFNPLRNTGAFAGKLLVDYLRVTVDYTDPKYSLKATTDNKVLVGSRFTYRLLLRNTNDAHQGYTIPVKIDIPAGFDYISDNGLFNPQTGIWKANLNKNGSAVIEILFRANASGDNLFYGETYWNQNITATVQGFNTTVNKTVSILAETLRGTVTSPKYVAQGKNITLVITVLNNSILTGAGNSDIYIEIPEGLSYHSSTGNGTFNPETSVWAVQFVNKKAVLRLTLNAVTEGTYTQNISSFSLDINNTFTVLESTITTCNYAEIYIPDDILPYLIPGQEYFLSCTSKIVTSNVGDIYEGANNFCISALIDDEETIGNRPTAYNLYSRLSVPFIYDPTKEIKFRIYGQYAELSPADFSMRCKKFSIASNSAKYEFAGSLANDPTLLIQDGNFATIDLDAGESSEDIILSNINLSGHESDPNLIIKGLGVGIDYNSDAIATLNVTLTSNEQSAKRSILLDPTQNTLQIGEEGDNWDLSNIDLTNMEITFGIDNTTLDPITIQIKNIQFILYWKYDETNGNMGFTMNGLHSRNKDIHMDNDSAKNEGTAPNITTYDISNSQGELITQIDLKAKKITLKFKISGDNLEDAQNKLTEATKYLSNDLNSVGLPIPNELIFDWDPERSYNVVLSDEIKTTLDTFVYTCEATLTVPDGCGFSGLKTTGAIGSNDGLIAVRPVINVVCEGAEKVQIFDNVSSQSLTINHEFEVGTVLNINCNSRIVEDTEGYDYTGNVTPNSTWPVISEDYDYSNSTGCLIQSIQYNEGS